MKAFQLTKGPKGYEQLYWCPSWPKNNKIFKKGGYLYGYIDAFEVLKKDDRMTEHAISLVWIMNIILQDDFFVGTALSLVSQFL